MADAAVNWLDDAEFAVGDVTFQAAPWARFPSTSTRFCVVKRPDLVERYIALIDALRPRTIVELGIFAGGSTALLAQLATPRKLLALELKSERVRGLDGYIEAHGASDRVRPYYGVDQGDQARVRAILDAELGDEPIDLVIDDASHDLALTRRSFDVLFPRLRPGGVFIVEDWSWAHRGFEAQRPGHTPLTVLVFELVAACGTADGLIAELTVDRDWALVRRGDRPLDPDTFAISACYGDRARALIPHR